MAGVMGFDLFKAFQDGSNRMGVEVTKVMPEGFNDLIKLFSSLDWSYEHMEKECRRAVNAGVYLEKSNGVVRDIERLSGPIVISLLVYEDDHLCREPIDAWFDASNEGERLFVDANRFNRDTELKSDV